MSLERREMDLSTTIANVRFSTCLMNASGALCVTKDELEALGRCRSGAIVADRPGSKPFSPPPVASSSPHRGPETPSGGAEGRP